MHPAKRDQIRHTLRNLAATHAALNDLMEQTLTLFNDELALDPLTFWQTRQSAKQLEQSRDLPLVDRGFLSVNFRGRSCFLGNTLPFRFFAHLAVRPGIYVTYAELFTKVWDCTVTDEAIRTVVKRLRSRLRLHGMAELADAIDGTVSGHYALKLKP